MFSIYGPSVFKNPAHLLAGGSASRSSRMVRLNTGCRISGAISANGSAQATLMHGWVRYRQTFRLDNRTAKQQYGASNVYDPGLCSVDGGVPSPFSSRMPAISCLGIFFRVSSLTFGSRTKVGR
jgi:hypothetical protein